MQIQIHSQDIALSAALRDYIETRLRRALGRLSLDLRRLAVFVRDLNGPRGGTDKLVRLQLKFDHGRDIVIAAVDRDLYAAIDCAVGRADHSLGRQLGRRRGFARQRWLAPNED